MGKFEKPLARRRKEKLMSHHVSWFGQSSY